MKINRRQFLKQVAAACAGIGAVGVVAPAVVVKEEPEKCGVGNRAKHIVIANGMDCNAPGRWENYYKDWLPSDPVIRQKFKAALRSYNFKPFPTESARLKYRAERGL